MLHSHNHIQMHAGTKSIMMNGYSSLEKYTYHTLFKMIMRERWVGDWTNCNILTSPVPLSLAALLSHSAESGVLRAHSPRLGGGSLYSILSPTNWTSCRTCLTPTCFLWASHLHPIQPVHSQSYTPISSTRCTRSLIDGWVKGQYVTHRQQTIFCVTLPRSVPRSQHKFLRFSVTDECHNATELHHCYTVIELGCIYVLLSKKN